MSETIDEFGEERDKLLGSLLLFTQVFYKLRTGRTFEISEPVSRESHQITICRELTSVLRCQTNRLIINVPPGHGKSELLIHFIAWALAHYPDSAFLYISYSHELAAKHTYTIKQIIQMPFYKNMFNVEIRRDSSAKDDFKTLQGGAVKAFGSLGAITGQDAGLPGLERFTGAIVIDDAHKPDEVHSDTVRESVVKNYNETIKPRARGPNVPFIFIGQRLHEADLAGNLIDGRDGYDWKRVILPSIDGAGNALHPKVNPLEMLRIEQVTNPYVFSSQYQQNPQPAGGGIFKTEWFALLDEQPKIISTFITADTAETNKDYNDATVFSFWGLYRISHGEIETDVYGLHWLDCLELRVEPKDLQPEFMQFYAACMRHSVKPTLCAIEKKSTGVTLLSVLHGLQGMLVLDIERTKASGNKTARFLSIQPYVATKRISFTRTAKHMNSCIEHMRKITANDTHRFDDIADTLYDAIKIALIDNAVPRGTYSKQDDIVAEIAAGFNQQQAILRRANELRPSS